MEASMLDELFGEAVLSRLGNGPRAQRIARLLFGLVGAGLGLAGAAHFALAPPARGNAAMTLSMIALFTFMASFSLFNVALGRRWRWPARLFVLSLVALFASRVLFGV
jgi:hypothetical protein